MSVKQCPICKSSLELIDDDHAFYFNQALKAGRCIGCGAHIEEIRDIVSDWIWVKVPITVGLSGYTHNNSLVKAKGNTLREVIDFIDAQYPGFAEKLDYATHDDISLPDNTFSAYVLLTVNGKWVWELHGWDTPMRGGDFVKIVTQIALA